jgi:hypothetical protein
MTQDDAALPEIRIIKELQDLIGKMDPDAMLAGFVVVAEWLEPDGENSLQVMHTPSSPWHMHGLLTYARDHHCGATTSFYEEFDEE